eukprot:TRINITY_DN1352_c0_g1_i1.p1 TRINITY_DN1352_c0_g1~~TRINITY_DN1352_c0_g1_i1.p1  ORF type:complete len:732 (-),score=197.89 TRINITY_DN1352_c0_g1_i1:61-2190(-)
MSAKFWALALFGIVSIPYILSARVVIEQDPSGGRVPAGWSELRSARSLGSETIELIVALKQRNVQQFEKLFWRISDPDHVDYQKFLTSEEIKKILAPTADDANAVLAHLEQSGATNVVLHESGDFIKCKISVNKAEAMLDTVYKKFKHAETGQTYVKPHMSYSLPEEIASKVDFVSGFYLPDLRSRAKKVLPQRNIVANTLNNGPLIARVAPLGEAAFLELAPQCEDGTMPSSFPLCNGALLSIEVVGVQAGVADNNQPMFTFTADDTNCGIQDTNLGNIAVCTLLVEDLEDYVETLFEIRSVFSTGFSNITVTSDFPIWTGPYITPELLRDFYGVPAGTVISNSQTSQSVAEFIGQFYSPKDLNMFFDLMALPEGQVTLIGKNNQSQPGGEASLDIQFIMGVAPDAPTTFWSIADDDDDQSDPFMTWITDVVNSKNPPLIHSFSYGQDEGDLTYGYAERLNIEFQKAGAMGLSIFISSGDIGVSGQGGCTPFEPSWPATSPFVTSVGATALSTLTLPVCESENVFGQNIPCTKVGERSASVDGDAIITSGGGASNFFSQPNYQTSSASVMSYVQEAAAVVPTSYWNKTGRLYPDIAALGHNFLVVIGEQVEPVDGTSASAPTAAGIFTLVTDHLLNNNQKPLGFLNPLLYKLQASTPDVFNDVKTGSNECGEQADQCCEYGFFATVGYDAVTGLGSPKYDKLIKALKK